jgi:hypothetical protein
MLPVVPVCGERLVETVAVAAILLVAALVAVSPHLLIGFPHGHSVNVNIFWHECFSEQLLAGELLPRWLFSFWGGLGAPVFYFYAPFPFYVLSLIDVFPVGQWGDFAVLSIGHLLLFFLSGAAFYVFVRPYTDRFWATVIAIGYMFAPYHYIDVEVRSAIGEASAYIWIPLILIGVCGPEKKWRSTVLAACGYAGLILSHLPSALLAAPAIALFSVLSGDRSGWLRAVGHALVVGVLGVALSAFYVLPALMLRDTLPHDAWVSGYGPRYAATSSLIGSSTVSRFSGTVHELLAWTSLVGVGFLALYIAVSKSRFSKGLEQPSKRMTAAIIAVLCLCWFLMSSLSWPIWEHFPFLSQVQFSWRLGVLVDICSLLLVALFAPPVIRSGLGFAGRRRRMLEYAVCSLALGALAISMMQGFFPPPVRAKSHIGRTRTLAPVEYRTRWLVESPLYLGSRTAADLKNIDVAPEVHRSGIGRWEKYVKPLPSIAAQRDLQPGESVSIKSDSVTRATISVAIDSAATIRLKKVYYPHWRLTDTAGGEVEAHPEEQTGLLIFELPPGRHQLTLDRRILPAEHAGILVSLFAVVGILVGLLVSRLRSHFSRRRRARPRSARRVAQW